MAENYDIELVGALTRSLEIGARVEEIRPLLSASFSESVIYIYVYIYNLETSSHLLSITAERKLAASITARNKEKRRVSRLVARE